MLRKAKLVVGIDYSQEAIDYAALNYFEKKCAFFKGDCSLKDIPEVPIMWNRFDIITSFEVIEHIDDYFTYLENIKRLLKDDGILIIGTPNRLQHFTRHYNWNKYHVQEFTPTNFRKLLELYFKDIQFYIHDLSPKVKDKTQRKKKFMDRAMKFLDKTVPKRLKDWGYPKYNKIMYNLSTDDIIIRKENDIKKLEECNSFIVVCKK